MNIQETTVPVMYMLVLCLVPAGTGTLVVPMHDFFLKVPGTNTARVPGPCAPSRNVGVQSTKTLAK